MSQMRIPITDAFDETDSLESLEVELTPKQIDWLQQKAEERGLSIDHMLRSVITAQIRIQNDPDQQSPMPAASGDGRPQAAADSEQNAANEDEGGSSSIVDSLRSASERLEDLTEEENLAEDRDTADPEDHHDTLERLRARSGNDSGTDDEPEDASAGSVLVDDESQSMFDMMDE